MLFPPILEADIRVRHIWSACSVQQTLSPQHTQATCQAHVEAMGEKNLEI